MATPTTHRRIEVADPTSTGVRKLPRELQQKLALLRLKMIEAAADIEFLQQYYGSHGMDDYGIYGHDVLERSKFLTELQQEIAKAYMEGCEYAPPSDPSVEPAKKERAPRELTEEEAALNSVNKNFPSLAGRLKRETASIDEDFDVVESMIAVEKKRRAAHQKSQFAEQYKLEREWFFRQGALPLAVAEHASLVDSRTTLERTPRKPSLRQLAERDPDCKFTYGYDHPSAPWPPKDCIAVPYQLCSERTALPIHESPNEYGTLIRQSASFAKDDAWLVELSSPVGKKPVETTTPASEAEVKGPSAVITLPDISSFGPKDARPLKRKLALTAEECFKALRNVDLRNGRPPP